MYGRDGQYDMQPSMVLGMCQYLQRSREAACSVSYHSNFLGSSPKLPSYWCSSVVERRSLTGELFLACTGPAADG